MEFVDSPGCRSDATILQNDNMKILNTRGVTLRMVSNKISHLALKKIWNEISRATEIIDDPNNTCGHDMRISHSLPCSCELITCCHPSARQQDMDSEMRSLTDLLHQINTRPISKVERCLILRKGYLSSVLPEDPGVTLTSPLEVVVTKGQKKTNSTKRDKSNWEHVSIAYRKIQKSSGSGSCSGSGSSSGSGPDFVFSDEHQWPELQIHDGYPIPPLQVQWIYHHTERVSNWADSYLERITN
ncbi:hypothetical protein M9H77_26067 [Catharanthus roseus]|uniref:Uncharacterized protein n=1 Tax=Catharanthus roseus TaxID=4058 RepID=A0ACC0A9G7_CATRO|nr:hypothetical protein M9H77_26067 [Catharanthus roseus]